MIVAIAAVTVIIAEVVSKKKRKAQIEVLDEMDLDDDGTVDAYLVDTTGDGKSDSVYIDTDGNGAIDTIVSDNDGDGEPDSVYEA